ncbi:MAG: TonB-dependent receptor, partial [Cellvibrionaceae bacterium]|nr:TonB-dependent receptor [Cellvibrionaceae bacterium]
ESLLQSIPNVNTASGASRGRFFQIRGIGERSQFVEPVNPSVGLLLDGIDMSGLGAAALMLDTQQVEVLRGPQGTLFGANALAGLIHIKANEPSDVFSGQLAASLGEFDSRELSATVTGPLSDSSAYRLAAKTNRSDGYMENRHLGRDDTGKIDETALRAKLRFEPSEDLRIDLTALYLDVDNGYDHFTLDNSRNTLSDQPGHDRQQSKAVAAKFDWALHPAYKLDANIALADSDIEYGYDEDWTYEGIDPLGYSSVDDYQRQRDTVNIDVRLISAAQGRLFNDSSDWLLGVYYFDQQEDLLRQYTYADSDFGSRFNTERQAVYGQLDSQLSANLNLLSGLRFEKHRNDYLDSRAIDGANEEDLWGAKLALSYTVDSANSVYALLSRGYKAGGFNTDGTLPVEQRSFATETLWNYELGYKGFWPALALSAQLALFYQDREDVQIKSSNPVAREDGSSEFIDFIDNSAAGESYGLELSAQWQISPSVSAYGNLGLLQTELQDSSLIRPGGDAAQAPGYQFALGLNAELGAGWYTSADVLGKDEFYFSDSHNAKARDYILLNAKIGYRQDGWDISLWGKNLGDKDYYTRGFGGFGNDPRDGYIASEYFQLAAPRQIGVSGRYQF